MDNTTSPKTPERGNNHPFYRDYQKQKQTPLRAKILGAQEFCEQKGLPCSREDIRAVFGVPAMTQKRIEKEGPRTYHSRQVEDGKTDKRGRQSVLSPKTMEGVKDFLIENGKPARELPFPLLADQNDIATHQESIPTTLIFNPSSLNDKRQSQRLIEKRHNQTGEEPQESSIHIRTFE
jgi:hypothetical protein